MKCQVCNFDDDEEQTLGVLDDKLKFVEVEGHFTVVTGDGRYRRRISIPVYACPKCETLKINNNSLEW